MSPSLELKKLERIIFPLAFRTKAVNSSTPETSSFASAPQPPAKGGQKEHESEKEADKET